MNLREQTYVCTLAKYCNLTTAANKLEITTSALSLYISNLEKKMGVKLFDRIGKRFALTYVGEVYCKAAQQMLALKTDFDNNVSNIVENYYGKITVGVQNYRSPHFSPWIICAFKEQYPNIEFRLKEISHDQAIEMLANGELDVYFGNCPHRESQMEYITLFQETYQLVAAKGHPISVNANPMSGYKYPWININYLKNEHILLQNTTTSSYQVVMDLFKENNFMPQNTSIVGKTETIIKLVSLGHGLAFYPVSFVKYLALKNPVEFYSVGNSQKLIEFAVVWRKGRELPQCTNDLIQIVRDLEHMLR